MKNVKTVEGVHKHTHTSNLKEIKNINKIEKIGILSLCQNLAQADISIFICVKWNKSYKIKERGKK